MIVRMSCIKKFAAPILTLALTAGLVAIVWVSVGSANPDAWAKSEWSNTDFSRTSIDFSEILSGGPPKDGIPSIDKPVFAQQSEVSDLADTEPVITVAIDGEARAYPLRVMIWHEIVNDEMAGTPISVTYCPLCNSAVVFDRRIAGKILDFGTTGKLRKSDLVMYDRQTESWWQQFTGEAIVGELNGTTLKTIPARLESYALFRERHPKGRVLVPNDPGMRAYGRNPYAGYDGRGRPLGFFQGPLPDYINPMARIIAYKVDGQPGAVALNLLSEKKRLEFGDIVMTWQAGQNSALDAGEIGSGRDVGNIVVQRKSQGGLKDMVYDVTFAFVFHAFHPDRKIRQN